MSSIYWYCFVAMIGVGIAVFTIYRKRHAVEASTIIVLYLFSTCVTWIGEFTVLGLFNSYAYKTGVFADPWAQNLLGHLILNSSLWPGTALLVVTFSLGYGWISLIAGANVLIEYLFLKLGIYEQHWWKYYMTAIAVFTFLVIVKKWFEKLNKNHRKMRRAITLYFVAFVLLHYPIPIILLLGKQYYNVHWIQDRYLSSTMFIFTYQLVEVFIIVFFIGVLKRWFWKMVPFITAYAGQIILIKMNILIFQDRWNVFYTMLLYSVSIALFIIIEKHALLPKPQ